MRRNLYSNLDLDEIIPDDFGSLDNLQEQSIERADDKITPIHLSQWTIVKAFNAINENVRKSRLETAFFVKCAEAFDFLSESLELNPVQSVVIALLIESGKVMTLRDMGAALGLSRLSMMTHYQEIEDLFKARWILHRGSCSDEENGGYALAPGVVNAIRENRPFVPEILECENTQEFVEKLSSHIDAGYRDEELLFSDEKFWIQELVKANESLPLCKLAISLDDIDSMSLLMLVVGDYYRYAGAEEEGLLPQDVQLIYRRGSTRNYHRIINSLQKGTHELFAKNLIEHKCEDGMANVNKYVATSFLKTDILSEVTPLAISSANSIHMSGLVSCNDITPKTLFYNKAEEEQVNRLTGLLSKEQLPLVQDRLERKGLRKGVCVLLHGAPGTGKTATAYELARQTGRDIIRVQVTDFKNKYVGESEARLKKIFSNYRSLCKESSVAPILLLNEGDAILSKRSTNVERSVDQMANSLQNILLEEMENLEGIMIVTTNLTTNLDSAFERRFIFKVPFEKPCTVVKAQIWKAMIEELGEEDSMELAASFDISGGEIENIARKVIIEYALTGRDPDLNMVRGFAKEEKLKPSTRPVVGFSTNK